MSRIKPVQIFTTTTHLFVIDEDGQIWRKRLVGGYWKEVGELPERKLGQ